MKRWLGIAVLVCLLSASAFAAKNSQDIVFGHAVQIGATTVPAGNYSASWTGAGEAVQVVIAHNGKTVATAPAKLVPAKNAHVSVVTNSVNGVDTVQSIDFNKCTLLFQ